MSSINSSSMASYLSSIYSGPSSLLSGNSQTSCSTSSFGGAYSLDLSDAALASLAGSGSSSSGLDGLLSGSSSTLSPSDSAGESANQLYSDIENMMDGGGSGDGGTSISDILDDAAPGGSIGQATADLANAGPLPTFIAMVDTQLHLDPTQQTALQNIADENMNATYTPATINTIANELQQAGI